MFDDYGPVFIFLQSQSIQNEIIFWAYLLSASLCPYTYCNKFFHVAVIVLLKTCC